MENLTTKEQETVQTLIRLGDSKEQAIKTVIEQRPTEAMKVAQSDTSADYLNWYFR